MSLLSRLKSLFGSGTPTDGAGDDASVAEGIGASGAATDESIPVVARQTRPRKEAADFDALEELLIDAGIDIETTLAILQEVRRAGLGRPTVEQLIDRIRRKLVESLTMDTTLQLDGSPAVVLVTGVNGVGKTTSIAKLAGLLKGQGKKVLLVAADTFRAGAIDQLAILGQRVGVPVMRSIEGQDPSSVVFNGLQKAVTDHDDVVIIDTAGRLENKRNLIDELRKVVRVIEVKHGLVLSEVLLVIDATTGENATMQARAFSEAIPVSGIILTKVDSGAKGGSIVSIARNLHIPIKLVCYGEAMTNIKQFDKQDVVDMILQSE
jgi:fused signal recognition particle receptor